MVTDGRKASTVLRENWVHRFTCLREPLTYICLTHSFRIKNRFTGHIKLGKTWLGWIQLKILLAWIDTLCLQQAHFRQKFFDQQLSLLQDLKSFAHSTTEWPKSWISSLYRKARIPCVYAKRKQPLPLNAARAFITFILSFWENDCTKEVWQTSNRNHVAVGGWRLARRA